MKNRIINFLLKPFTAEFALWIIFFLLIGGLDTIFEISRCNYKSSIYVLSHGVLQSYLLVLICSSFGHFINTILRFLFFCLSFSFFSINLYCFVHFSSLEVKYVKDVIGIILGTNPSEIFEFISTSISPQMFLLFLLSVFLIALIYYLFTTRIKLTLKAHKLYFILLFVCSFLSLHNKYPYQQLLFGEINIAWSNANVPDLKDYFTHPSIERVSSQPQNIVFIIGESLARKHCSLYGYSKNTNPYLTSLYKDSTLTIFDNVQSSGLHTIASFQAMMSTYKPSFGDSVAWYKCTTLPEIIKYSNYHSVWISNQSKQGIYDNIIGRYADLCDENHFVGNKYAGLQRSTLDEEVLPILKNHTKDSNQFFFIHLMGSHRDFRERYPSQFHRFTEKDYLSYPQKQQYNLATYDNSVLYNDSIVYEIMNQFRGKEAIVFYFPDHSIDIYDSSDDYVGHAIPNNPKSMHAGYQIPFVVYCSPSYQDAFPSIVKRLKENMHKSYATENILYTAMEIMGVKFTNNEDVKRFSLLSDDKK